jgi:hypothetical protein
MMDAFHIISRREQLNDLLGAHLSSYIGNYPPLATGADH